MLVCSKNLFFVKKLQKQANNKDVKFWSYIFSNKISLNNKYIITKKD